MGQKAVNLYQQYEADRIIGEVNNGGDMIESLLRVVDSSVSYKSVRASRGKAIRAEPVSALYEHGRVKHIKPLTKLENQLTTWCPETSDDSPDRLDALVWGLTELMVGKKKGGVW